MPSFEDDERTSRAALLKFKRSKDAAKKPPTKEEKASEEERNSRVGASEPQSSFMSMIKGAKSGFASEKALSAEQKAAAPVATSSEETGWARKKHIEDHPEVEALRQKVIKLTDGPESPEAHKEYEQLRAQQDAAREKAGKEFDEGGAAKSPAAAMQKAPKIKSEGVTRFEKPAATRQESVTHHEEQAKKHAELAKSPNLGGKAQTAHAEAAKLHKTAAKEYETGNARDAAEAAQAARNASANAPAKPGTSNAATETGPRGGRYTIGPSGGKVYVK